MSKWLALTAIGTQLILGLVLVAILLTLQGQGSNQPPYTGPYCSPQGVCDPMPGVGPWGLPSTAP